MKKITLLILLLLSACAKNEGTSTGNPLVSLRFNNFNALSAPDFGAATVSNLVLCIKRLRFKPVTGLAENIDLALGETIVTTTGTFVTAAQVPPGSYFRVEFDLNTTCASGKSVQLTNSLGTFSSIDTITIRFDGTLNLTASQGLDLNIQAIINALNTANSNADIKIKAESVGGSF